MINKKYLKLALGGVAIGLINGFFGTGGGLLAVSFLKSLGFEKRESHANAVAVILPICILSAGLYIFKDYVEISHAAAFIPTGLLGALIGTMILKKISPMWLKRIFGAFMIYAGVRLLLR